MADDIRECTDGAEALSAFQEYCPDLVLMDIEMARKDGIAATREIMAACPEAKVVIVSRHGDEQTRDAARLAGACGYVLKEDLLALRELVGEFTQRRGAGATLPEAAPAADSERLRDEPDRPGRTATPQSGPAPRAFQQP